MLATAGSRAGRIVDMYGRYLKRPVDLAAASLLLIALSPVLLLVALTVLVVDGRPVLFVQVRPGRGERPFPMYKFRTMTTATDARGEPLPDGARVTALGRLLRRTSLDELPELFNVVAGTMSLVGPRPLLTRYLPYYTESERARFLLRPGITGLAQVRGRNLLGWSQRLALDVEYQARLSFVLDVRILLWTVAAVFGARGVAVVPDAVMQNLDVERAGFVSSPSRAVPATSGERGARS